LLGLPIGLPAPLLAMIAPNKFKLFIWVVSIH